MNSKKNKNENVGNVVFWKDPDAGENTDYCRVVGFRNRTYTLRHMFLDEGDFKAGDGEVERLDESLQVKAYIKYLRKHHGLDGLV